MGVTPPKRLKQWVRLAENEGWTYDETEDGHPRLTPPKDLTDVRRNGLPAAPVTFSKTSSDIRGDRNTVAALRRLGVPIPHKGKACGKDSK